MVQNCWVFFIYFFSKKKFWMETICREHFFVKNFFLFQFKTKKNCYWNWCPSLSTRPRQQIELNLISWQYPLINYPVHSEAGRSELKTFLETIQNLSQKYGFRIIDQYPNPCMQKNINSKGERYNTNIDITLYKVK